MKTLSEVEHEIIETLRKVEMYIINMPGEGYVDNLAEWINKKIRDAGIDIPNES